jgi:indole-3-glycerol phosphate synthase
MSILETIIKEKQKEVAEQKKSYPLKSFKNKIKPTKKDFAKHITTNSIIAEIKPKSPSKGNLIKNRKATDILKAYKNADCISVLTDKKFFAGSLNLLRTIRNHTTKPIVRKDFIIDEYQIYQARYFGADAILLIASILTKEEIIHFQKIAQSLNMKCIIEVHNKEELEKVLSCDPKIIGINNRDLHTLKTNIKTTNILAASIPKDIKIISESGIETKEDFQEVTKHANGVLIGTSLMQASNIEKKLEELRG